MDIIGLFDLQTPLMSIVFQDEFNICVFRLINEEFSSAINNIGWEVTTACCIQLRFKISANYV